MKSQETPFAPFLERRVLTIDRSLAVPWYYKVALSNSIDSPWLFVFRVSRNRKDRVGAWHRVVWRGAANTIAFKLFEAHK
jgi:hypothetical protein